MKAPNKCSFSLADLTALENIYNPWRATSTTQKTTFSLEVIFWPSTKFMASSKFQFDVVVTCENPILSLILLKLAVVRLPIDECICNKEWMEPWTILFSSFFCKLFCLEIWTFIYPSHPRDYIHSTI